MELVLNHNSISKIIFSEDMLCQLKKLDVGYNRLDNFHVNSGLTELKLNNIFLRIEFLVVLTN